MEGDKITLYAVGTVLAVTCIFLIVMAFESGRKADLVLSQLREMRTAMGEAGFLPSEPQFARDKKYDESK